MNTPGTERDTPVLLDPSARRGWWVALRPHTLPASVSPVLVGCGLAWHRNVFHLPSALLCLLVALLLQTAVNLANDYDDYARGVDTDDRRGFPRACASGLLPPEQVRTAARVCLAATLVPGLYLVSEGGVPLLIAGVLSLLGALGYSGGPVPLGSVGLGDPLVFVFFGLVAVTGTFYTQACAAVAGLFPLVPPPGTLPPASVLVALPAGALSTNILVINNLRDRPGDEEAGKRTLAVLLGERGSLVEFSLMMALSYLVPVGLYAGSTFGPWVLLPLLTLPEAARILWGLSRCEDPGRMNDLLSRTGRLLFLHSLLFAVGLLP